MRRPGTSTQPPRRPGWWQFTVTMEAADVAVPILRTETTPCSMREGMGTRAGERATRPPGPCGAGACICACAEASATKARLAALAAMSAIRNVLVFMELSPETSLARIELGAIAR